VEKGAQSEKKKLLGWEALGGRAAPMRWMLKERGNHQERLRTKDGAWEQKRSEMSSSGRVRMGGTRHIAN
jgi:hypothetical protein